MKTSTIQPLYMQIRQHIIEQIVDGAWSPHDKIPPERELAELFSVSRITAKNAVLQLVNEGILYRHRGKGTFVSDGIANQLNENQQSKKRTPIIAPKKQSKIIGFVIPWVERQYTTLLLNGIEAYLSKHGYHLIFRRVSSSEEEKSAIQSLVELPVDGIIVATSRGEFFDNGLVQLVINHFPLVFIEKTMRDLHVNGIFCDVEHAGRLMARYLIQRQITEIGLVSYPISFSYGVRERRYGFQTELMQAGVAPLADDKILTLPGEVMATIDQSQRRIKIPEEIYHYLRRFPHMKAIAVADALLARMVGQACFELGLTEMIIVGFDEPSYFPNMIYPSAYIDQSPFLMGQTAGKIMLEVLQNKQFERQIMIEPKLIELR